VLVCLQSLNIKHCKKEREKRTGEMSMRFLTSSLIQFLLFGALNALFITQGPDQAWPVMGLFVVGELGGMAVVCSLIVRQFDKAHVPDVLMTAVVGFIVSHLGILTVLHLGLFSSQAPRVPGQSTLAWMELTLRVGLIVVMTSTAGVLFRPRIRKFAEARIRKDSAAA
jgi:hypothetical protein